jgi:hypothetical protein
MAVDPSSPAVLYSCGVDTRAMRGNADVRSRELCLSASQLQRAAPIAASAVRRHADRASNPFDQKV